MRKKPRKQNASKAGKRIARTQRTAPKTPAAQSAREQFMRMLKGVKLLHTKAAAQINRYPSTPLPNSQAQKERADFPHPAVIKDAHIRGTLSIEAAADHLMAFHDALAEPSSSIAIWTLVRGLLESCALACWFLDPAIDARARVARRFSWRYKGFDEQEKMIRLTGDDQTLELHARLIASLEAEALELGYPQCRDRNGNIYSVAMPTPAITQLIGEILGRELDYRILSAAAHCHHWALAQLSFREVPGAEMVDPDLRRVEKNLQPEAVMYLVSTSVAAFARPLWYLARLYGWEVQAMEAMLDESFSQIGMGPIQRFWHAT